MISCFYWGRLHGCTLHSPSLLVQFSSSCFAHIGSNLLMLVVGFSQESVVHAVPLLACVVPPSSCMALALSMICLCMFVSCARSSRGELCSRLSSMGGSGADLRLPRSECGSCSLRCRVVHGPFCPYFVATAAGIRARTIVPRLYFEAPSRIPARCGMLQ